MCKVQRREIFSMEKQGDEDKKRMMSYKPPDAPHIVNCLLQTNHFSMQF